MIKTASQVIAPNLCGWFSYEARWRNLGEVTWALWRYRVKWTFHDTLSIQIEANSNKIYSIVNTTHLFHLLSKFISSILCDAVVYIPYKPATNRYKTQKNAIIILGKPDNRD